MVGARFFSRSIITSPGLSFRSISAQVLGRGFIIKALHSYDKRLKSAATKILWENQILRFFAGPTETLTFLSHEWIGAPIISFTNTRGR